MISSGKSGKQQAGLKKFLSFRHLMLRVDSPFLSRLALGLAGIGLILLTIPLMAYGWFSFSYKQRVFPGISVAGIDVGGLTASQALSRIQEEVRVYETNQWPITVRYQNEEWTLDPMILHWKLDETVGKLFTVGRGGHWKENLIDQWQLIHQGRDLPIELSLESEQLEPLLTQMGELVDEEEVLPTLSKLEEPKDGSLVAYQEGQDGHLFERTQYKQSLLTAAAHLKSPPSGIPIHTIHTEISKQQRLEAIQRAERLLTKQLRLTIENEADFEWQMTDTDTLSFVDFQTNYNLDKISGYLKEVSSKINREPIDAKFRFDEQTGKVVEFAAAKDGLELDVVASAQAIRVGLELLEQAADEQVLGMASNSLEPGLVRLVVHRVEPELTLNDANNLGITSLLGRGVSTYFHSIPSRVHNVELAASRVAGTLVKPGETFSFNQAVGEVSGATGYQAAYVISNGKTELGDGGGVCQDSTTVFRAALDAGLPIVERRGHSYRVGYYEQNAKAGLDATVYAPSTDLKFLNDTPAHILVQTTVDSPNRTLVVEIYGTSDGRSSEILNHIVYDVVPALPDQYIDDPTLSPGEVKQIDWAAGGAKAKFEYVVRRNGEVINEKTFNTVYKPWAAKFLRGV